MSASTSNPSRTRPARTSRTVTLSNRANPGDYVVIVAGSPPGIPGSTNAMRVHRIGDATAEVAEGYAEE